MATVEDLSEGVRTRFATNYLLILKRANNKKGPYPILASIIGINSVISPDPVDLKVVGNITHSSRYQHESPSKDAEGVALSANFLWPDFRSV
jgi:hypothetical protein